MLKFVDIKDELVQIIKKIPLANFPGETGITLVEGFFNFPIQSEFSGNIVLGGPSIPMIAVVGNESGRIYYFALKKLLPNVQI